MTADRLEILTKLARTVWPDRNVSAVVGDNMDEIGAGIIADADEDWAQLVIVENHPRALDALEAALHVLANDTGQPPVEAFTLEQLLGADGTASLLPDVRKTLEAFLGFERGCVASMQNSARLTREHARREKARADAAERELTALTARVTNAAKMMAKLEDSIRFGRSHESDAEETMREEFLFQLRRVIWALEGTP